MHKTAHIVALSRILLDASSLFLALIAAYMIRMKFFALSFFDGLYTVEIFTPPITLFPFDLFINFAVQFTVIILTIFAIQGRYKFEADQKILDEFSGIFWSLASGLALLAIFFFFAQFQFFSRLVFALSWVLSFVFILIGRILIRMVQHYLHTQGIGQQRLLILGTGHLAFRVLSKVKVDNSIQVVGLLSEKKSSKTTLESYKVLGNFRNLEKVLKAQHIDEIWLASDNVKENLTAQLVRIAQTQHTKFRIFPDELTLDLAAVHTSTYKDLPLITLQNSALHGWGLLVKTSIDIFVATIALILLSPLMVFIIIRTWISDRTAPVFYASKRVGFGGKEFWCYKFRTMIKEAEDQKKDLMKKNERKGDVFFKIKDDPRITPFGAFLRKYSLDELPQLWNVLIRDMSLIGPRPHLANEVKKYPKENLQLLSIRPGITGFSQVNGQSDLSFEEEMKYEMFYLKNWSLWMDLIIGYKSILVVIKGRNR